MLQRIAKMPRRRRKGQGNGKIMEYYPLTKNDNFFYLDNKKNIFIQ